MIHTENLILEPFSERFLTTTYISWLNDKDLMRFSEQRHKIHTLVSCRKYWLKQLSDGNLFLAISLKGNRLYIGTITARIDKNNSVADLGILIGERRGRGRGYGREAWYVLMDYLFKKEKIRKITAGAIEDNHRMIDIFEKSQMLLEAIRPHHYEINGAPVTVVYYSAYRANWN